VKALTLTGATVLCFLVAGCIYLPPDPRRSEPVTKMAIGYKRIAIVSFYDRTPYARTAEHFTEQLRDKLAEWTESTDVIVVPREDLPSLGDPFVGGSIPLGALVDIRGKYLADAVIIGSVDEHNPYWQPSVHVSLKVIDTATAAFPYELSEGWDGGEDAVRKQIDAYYRRNYQKDDCRFGPELFTTSPSYFLRFVADRIAETITAAL
jgi:hypothetical protein